MDALDAVIPLVAVVAPTAVVLRDIVGYDRPPAAPQPAPQVAPDAPAPDAAGAAPVPEPVGPEAVEPEPVVPEPVEPAAPAVPEGRPAPRTAAEDDGVAVSMLARLTTTEADERSWLRRVRALLIVVVLTLLTAALVGAGIYRAVSRLG